MKQAINFRLSAQAMYALNMLEKTLHITKTTAVEQALINYAHEQLQKEHPLLKYAGTLDEKDADEILEVIKSSRHNKNSNEIEL